MHTQLRRNPANLKNATRDIDLSSWGVREDVKIERNTAGVTGNRLDGLGGGGCSGWFDILGAIMVDELVEVIVVTD